MLGIVALLSRVLKVKSVYLKHKAKKWKVSTEALYEVETQEPFGFFLVTVQRCGKRRISYVIKP